MSTRDSLLRKFLLGLAIVAAAGWALAEPPKSAKSNPAQPAPAAAAFLRFSEPVNGLVARIEGMHHNYIYGHVLMVRLENRGKTPLAVPTRNPADPATKSPFTLYGRADGEWKSIPWRPNPGDYEHDSSFGDRHNAAFDRDPMWPAITLQPGESVLAYVGGYFAGMSLYRWRYIDDLAELKIVLHRERSDLPNTWTGTLETPPYPLYCGPKVEEELAGQVPMPTYFPPFRHERLEGLSDGGEMEDLQNSNRTRLAQLQLYRSADVARELAKRIPGEKDALLRKLYAITMYSVAAGDLSERISYDDALKALDERRQRDGANWQPTRAWVMDALLDALEKAPRRPGIMLTLGELRCRKARPVLEKLARTPEYRGDAAEALGRIGDPRSVAALLEILPLAAKEPYKDWGPSYTMAQPVVNALVELHAKEAVLPIVELAKTCRREHLHSYVCALAELGDARAVPPLIGLLAAEEKRLPAGGQGTVKTFDTLVEALAKLHATEAVPILLANLDRPSCVTALGEIGDRRAVPALEKLTAVKGENYVEGRAALAKLGPGEPTDRYIALATDKSLSDWDRATLAPLLPASLPPDPCIALLADKSISDWSKIWIVRLLPASLPPRVVPQLVEIVKNDLGCHVTLGCIEALGHIKHPAAVEALIGCFDLDFTTKTKEQLGMYRYAEPSDYPDEIASSLRKITGANIGTNKAHWQKWWQEEGKKGKWL